MVTGSAAAEKKSSQASDREHTTTTFSSVSYRRRRHQACHRCSPAVPRCFRRGRIIGVQQKTVMRYDLRCLCFRVMFEEMYWEADLVFGFLFFKVILIVFIFQQKSILFNIIFSLSLSEIYCSVSMSFPNKIDYERNIKGHLCSIVFKIKQKTFYTS